MNTICCRKDDTSRAMMNNFIDVFSTILSYDSIELGEYLLFSGWIDRYLLECSNKMVGTLMKVLVNVFERCIYVAKTSNTGVLFFHCIIFIIYICILIHLFVGNVEQMLDVLWCYVASRVRQLVFDPVLANEHYKSISKLAVLFTLEALKNPAIAKKHKHSATSLFQLFASSIIVKDIG